MCPSEPHAMLYVGSGLFALCDWEDWPLVRGYWWHLTTDTGDVRYAQTWDSHDTANRKRITMHGLLMPTPKGFVSDHINGNGLDNRRANLRLATPTENAWNRRRHRDSSSRFKGVSFDKDTGRWRAGIHVAGKVIYLGRFDSEDEAGMAYENASRRYRGEFGVPRHG